MLKTFYHLGKLEEVMKFIHLNMTGRYMYTAETLLQTSCEFRGLSTILKKGLYCASLNVPRS
jgi:hypothetical protein